MISEVRRRKVTTKKEKAVKVGGGAVSCGLNCGLDFWVLFSKSMKKLAGTTELEPATCATYPLKRTPRLSGQPAHSVLIELLECYEHLNDSRTPFEWFHRLADDSAKHPATVGSLHRVSWSRGCHE